MKSSKSTREESDCRLDRIIADYYHALDAGQAPEPYEFIARYPEFQRELREFFADVAMSDGRKRIRESNAVSGIPKKERPIP